MATLSPIQNEIFKALEQLQEKQTFTEFVLAKKIRTNINLTGKQKAGIGLNDLEKAVLAIGEQKQIFYSLHLNSANDLLIKKCSDDASEPELLSADARGRRQSSEKSMVIFSNSDVKKSDNGKGKQKIRSERKKININSDFDDLD